MAKDEGPLVIGHRLRFLTPNEVEARLLRTSNLLDPSGKWTATVMQRGLFLDLSLVEWVDLGALVHLMLLIESALRGGIDVQVALPLTRLQGTERELLEEAKQPGTSDEVRKSVERRSSVLRFLEYMNFQPALQAPHIRSLNGKLSFLPHFDSSARGRTIEREHQAPVEEPNLESRTSSEPLYRYCFPLQWFSGEATENRDNMAWFLAEVVGQPKRGLESIDAGSVANVILYELVDNVRQHAGGQGNQRMALVAAWARPREFPPSPNDYLEVERPFIEWAREASVPIVEVLIGDSGRGVSNALAQKFRAARALGMDLPTRARKESGNILLWAFDRWSSSRESEGLRGTRGLYRVDRVVRKYQGLITVRAYENLVGWDHGGPAYDSAIVHGTPLSLLPGTLIRLRIPAFREAKPTWRAFAGVPEHTRFLRIQQESIDQAGLSDSANLALRQALGEGRIDKPLCVVAAVDAPLGNPKGIEAVLKQAVEGRHPATLVLSGLPGGWETIESAVNSINSEHMTRARSREEFKRDHWEIWDPVLVIGERGQYAWAGVTESHARILDALLEAPLGVLSPPQLRNVFNSLGISGSERAALRRDLRNDSGLVSFRRDGGIAICLTVQGILDNVSSTLRAHVLQGGKGVLKDSIYRTPSLILVDKWLSIDAVFDATCGGDLAMLSLAARARGQAWWNHVATENVLVADESVNPLRLRDLRKHLDPHRFRVEVMPGETGAPIAHGVSLVARGASALIYCDVILSTETVRRCLSQILRDEAQPLAILCSFDARETPGHPIEMWGIEVPVVSLAEVEMLRGYGVAGDAKSMNPITREREAGTPAPELPHRIDDETLHRALLNRQALHFSHVGRPIGRHFTFYLDVGKLLEEATFLASLTATMNDWVKQLREEGKAASELELWYAGPVPNPPPPNRTFGDWVTSVRKDVRYVRVIRRESAYGRWTFAGNPETRVRYPFVLIVDWGALTGSSMMQMIRLAAEAGAEAILACVFVSQLSQDEERFLSSLRRIEVVGSRDQLLLPGLDPKPKSLKRPVDLKVEFLSSLPFGVYERSECPVCQQLARLSHESYPTELLANFSRRQRERSFRERTRDEVINSNPRDFDGRDLAPASVLWMLGFRKRLSGALVSTTSRLEVLAELISINDELRGGSSQGQRQAFDFLHFLSVESQWLRRAPLNFRRLREQVAEIALQVALDEDVSDFERLHAIIVLRSSSKYVFARQFPGILAKSHESEVLIHQLLYSVFTYLSRSYHQTMQLLKPLKSGLESIREAIDSRRLSVSGEVAETVMALLVRVEIEYARAGTRDLTALQAWRELRRVFGPSYSSAHSEPVKSADLLQPGPDAEPIERSLEEFQRVGGRMSSLDIGAVSYLKRLDSHWETCRRFLDYTVFPILQHLRPILLSKDGTSSLGTETAARLIYFIESKDPISESEFSRLVREVSLDPNKIFGEDKWEKISAECFWLWDRVFRPGGVESRSSRLIEFLRMAPVRLESVFADTVASIRGKTPNVVIPSTLGLGDSSVEVFCTRELLRDVLEEIMLNCEDHRAEEMPGVELRVEIEELNDEEVVVAFRNNNTEEAEEPGVGLDTLSKRLEPFGASLRLHSRIQDGWSTFRVDAAFLRAAGFGEAI